MRWGVGKVWGKVRRYEGVGKSKGKCGGVKKCGGEIV